MSQESSRYQQLSQLESEEDGLDQEDGYDDEEGLEGRQLRGHATASGRVRVISAGKHNMGGKSKNQRRIGPSVSRFLYKLFAEEW